MADYEVTPEFRVSYPKVFKAERNTMNGKDEYSVVALFTSKTDLGKLKSMAKAAIEKKWGSDTSKWPQKVVDGKVVSAIKTPFRDQGERAKIVEGKEVLPAGYEKGAVFMNLRTTEKPPILDGAKKDLNDPSQFYAGCWARAIINCFAYDTKGNQGVSFSLASLQKVRDDDPLSGRPNPQDFFSLVEGATPAAGATGSATDLF